MSERFFISDTHFDHYKIVHVFDPPRPFSSVEEMNETIIENWNERVGPKDTVVHLGDVAFKPQNLRHLARCNGRKILIKGNHDTLKLKYYLRYFEDVRACDVKERILFTHIPIHLESLGRFKANVHGHTHFNRVMTCNSKNKKATAIPDPRYINICVEQTNYSPISFDEIKEKVNEL